MSVMSRVGGAAVLVAAAIVVAPMLSRPADNRPPTHRTPRGDGQARVVGWWERNRDFSVLYTAGGVTFPELVERVSPFEHVIAVRPGETVTITLTPLASASGKHGCIIEYPLGHPVTVPGGQATTAGAARALCTAVIGA